MPNNDFNPNKINFDPNQFIQFDRQMFGPKAFDFSNVQKTVQMQAQAEAMRKQVLNLYQQRLHPPKPKKPDKKTYQDAVDYWNANPGLYQGKGAYAVANDILNDPAKQAEIKSQGFNVSDYINGLYNAASGGQFRSQREYGQYNNNLKSQISAKDKAYKDKHGGLSQQQVYDMQQQANKVNKPNHDNKGGFLNNVGGLFKDLGHDVTQKAKGAGSELANIWKAISDGPGGYTLNDVANATQNTVKKQQKQDAKRGYSSNLSKEVHRGANRAMDAAMFGNLSSFQNAENAQGYNYNTDYANTRKLGKGGATDFITSGLGYLVPGGYSYDVAKGLGLGEKIASSLANRGASKGLQNITKLSTEGATAGGAFGTMQSIADPNMTAKERLLNIPLNAGIGAVADPLLHGAVKGLGRLKKTPNIPPPPKGGFQSEAAATVDNAVNNGQVASKFDNAVNDLKSRGYIDSNNKPIKPNDFRVVKEIDSRIKNLQDKLQVKPTPDLRNQLGLLRNQRKQAVNEFKDTVKGFKQLRSDYLDHQNQKLTVGIGSLKNAKDLSHSKVYTQDPIRNFRQVLGKNAEPVINRIDKAKGEYVDMQNHYLSQLKSYIVDGLGIKKGSKESALVQKYGEKKINLDELKQQAPNKWQNIVNAEKWFKEKYNELLTQVNKVRSDIYPNNPSKQVPQRQDYFHHFRELTGLEGIKNLFDTPAGIDPSLVGTSEFTKPNSKFAGFMQQRMNGSYKNDAVGGFLKYLPAASYSTNIDPIIKMVRNMEKEVKTQTTDTGHLNNFINFLDKYSQDLAGKTNPADRFVQESIPGGRTTFYLLNMLNSRIKKNAILGNLGSALAQVSNIPQGIAFAKQYAIKGAGKTILNVLKGSPSNESTFLKERFHGRMYSQFDTKLTKQPEKLAGWVLETADRIGTTFIWNSSYEKALAQGIKDPVRFADNATRDLVAGRGIGEVPILQKSKLFQLIAPFQLEVANLWRVQKDFLKRKDIGGLMALYLANMMLNKEMEKVRGSKVVFDPIQAIIDASQPGLTPLQRAGRIGGEILSNMPMGQTIAAQYPENGFGNFPTRKGLFGSNDPTRFGSGLADVLTKGLQDPVYKIAFPFGGAQVEKTRNAIKDINSGGVYNNSNTQLKYPVAPTQSNKAKGLLFGPGAFNETRPYYDNNGRPLGVKDTKTYNNSPNKQLFYDNLMKKRELGALTRKIKSVEKNNTISDKDKQKKLLDLFKQLQKVGGR